MQLVPIVVPQLGNAMEEVTVAEWYFDVGERVEEGEPVVMIDSEKAQSELEALIRKSGKAVSSVTSNAVEVRPDLELHDVELRLPFPGCEKEKRE